jgi:hypothetical protein
LIIELKKLHDLGFSLIPIEPRGKRPIGPWQQYQTERRSWEEVAELHEQYEENGQTLNWAIVCGKVSSLAVVDIDPRNGGDLAKIQDYLGCRTDNPEGRTMYVQTGGGGVHIYFSLHERDDLTSVPNWRPGVDLCAEKHYVIAPGSIHPSGEPYTTLIEGPLRDAPGQLWTPRLHAASEATTDDGEREPWIAQALAHPELVEAGQQNETILKLAMYLSGGLPEDIARGILVGFVNGLTNHDPNWRWDESYIDRPLETAYAKRGKERRLRMDGVPRGSVNQEHTSRDLPPLREVIKSAKEFSEEQGEDIPWIIDGLFAPGCLVEILGSVKAGKSTWVCGAIWCILNGEPWLGRPVQKGKVLYVTEQAGTSFRKTLERGRIDKHEDLYIVTPTQLHGREWDDAVEEIMEVASELGCGTVVFDTLARLAGLAGDEENSSGVAMRVLRPFQVAKAKNLAVLFVRHGRKSGGTINEMGRGSNAYSGEMDVIVGLRVLDEEHKKMEVSGRLDEPSSCTLRYTGGTYVLGEDPQAEANKQNDEQRVELLLAEIAKAPASSAKLGKALGMGRPTVERLLKPHLGSLVAKVKGQYKPNGTLNMEGME